MLPRLPARYRVEKELGSGSQKSVYLAHDSEGDRWVAVSAFETSALSDADLERIRQVHELAGSSSYPHVLPIELSESDGSLFLVSPFLAGGDLARRLEQGGRTPLPLAETLQIGSQVCRALESIHAAGIAHRDVKPGNILLDERGDAHLGDFGLAIQTGSGVYAGVAGTPAYIAPEQITNPPGGFAADLYSLGCVLYELATGRPPFVGDHASEVLRQHLMARPVPAIERNSSVPRVLSELILKLLEKLPGVRPSSAGDVRAALDGMLRGPRGLAVTTRTALELPLVGRDRELALLETALARVSESRPGLVLVSGEAGSGKSRLLSELRSRVEAKGCVVLAGTGDEPGAASYQPIADALLPLAGHLSELDPMQGDLLRDFLYRGSAARRDPLTPRGPERERLFAAVLAVLTGFARARPLVLFLEDLHAFDAGSIDLLEHLAAALIPRGGREGLALLVVASTRPNSDPRLATLANALRDNASCEALALRPLDEAAVQDLLTALGAERRAAGRLATKVLQTTDGNPLFVREIVLRLRDADALGARSEDLTDDAWETEIGPPLSVDRAIAERIERLDARVLALLRPGALLGTRFEIAQLVLVSDLPEHEVEGALEPAVAQGVIVGEGVAYSFAHPLIRQAVRDGLPLAERQQIHFRIARRLLDPGSGASAAQAIAAAHHLVRSGPLADPTDLARIAGRAGREALARFAWREAADLLETAIEAVRRGAHLDTREQGELYRNAGLTYFRLMEVKPCAEHYDAAIAIFERSGDERELARALHDRATASLLTTSYGELNGVEPLERALARLDPAEVTLRAQILRTLSEFYWSAGQPERAERMGAETLELARQAGDYGLCAEASIDLGTARFLTMRLEAALDTWQSGAADARRASHLLAEQRCLARSGLVLTAMGRLDEAQEAIRAVQGMHEVLQLHGEMAIGSAVLVSIAVVRGDFEVAALHAAEAVERARRVGYAWAMMLCLPALSCARAMLNDVAGARRAIHQLFERGTGFENVSAVESLGRCYEWLADWYAGDTHGIDVREMSSLLPRMCEEGNATAACTLVELADALQMPSLAAAADSLLELAERQGLVFWSGWPFFLPRLRGVGAALAGRLDEATDRLAAAIEIARRVGAASEHARARLDLARVLATRNGPGDRARARELVAECRTTFTAQGPAAFVERAERLHAFLAEARG